MYETGLLRKLYRFLFGYQPNDAKPEWDLLNDQLLSIQRDNARVARWLASGLVASAIAAVGFAMWYESQPLGADAVLDLLGPGVVTENLIVVAVGKAVVGSMALIYTLFAFRPVRSLLQREPEKKERTRSLKLPLGYGEAAWSDKEGPRTSSRDGGGVGEEEKGG